MSTASPAPHLPAQPTRAGQGTRARGGSRPGLLVGSGSFSALARGKRRRSSATGRLRRPEPREQGVALVVIMTVVAIMTIFLTEMLGSTTTGFHVATSERDKLKAEYLARSGLNLTRLLISKEREIRQVVSPLYMALIGRPPPQLNVWAFADAIFAPFSDLAGAMETGAMGGIDFNQMEGLKETGGRFEVITIPENSMINVSTPLFRAGDVARRSIAMQLFALMGGYDSPNSPYDIMFTQRDADGQFTTRFDIVSDVIDWWDDDQQRTVFEAGASSVANAGSEDDIYSQFAEPYLVKNAAYDSLEELRLIRGVGDDFWANFIESDPEDPRSRHVTIYGSGSVNPNEARPQVMLARLCSYVIDQPLCLDPLQKLAFISLFDMARQLVPVALFSSADDFLNFVEGKGTGKDLYPMLQALPGLADSPLMAWTPVVIPADRRAEIAGAFITSAAIFTIQSIGQVGRARARISAVVNFDPLWVPPPMNAAKPSKLGVFHHYRLD